MQIELDEDIKHRLKENELKTERENICIRESLFNLAKTLKNIGHKVYLISDFYLEKRDLLSILPEELVKEFSDSLYVSGDSGNCKSSGKLFEQLQQENTDFIDNSRNYFIGDNWHSDFKIPNEMKFANSIAIPTIAKTCLSDDFSKRFSSLSSVHLSREYRTAVINNQDRLPYFISLALIYTAKYIKSLHNSLDSDTAVLFLGRDGYLLNKVFNLTYPNIKTNYAINSRSLNFNAIIESSDDISYCLNRDGNTTTVDKLLYSRLGFRIDSTVSKDISSKMLSQLNHAGYSGQ
ncbi:hypothetical protein JCM19239_3929 [Vibrio variabilis]|uniref:Uncharacterized protein n=1 Tax=Vibrio variabilis TaxID=990271 RepID=A0ABQ0J612_9VIBR|nr:hypothetical protein JCM19239_3929 [Vibrio variabilis]